ncbi:MULTISPECIES: hypothetical protein [Ramlibacter]|uniref:Uncharacterized protein n=1 Tax=Ramlibacter pinisoli TaxID=2682844 RepID=A0A6N8IY55_9BURK|nr:MULTISPECIES: hypothetical protein [Ramlibacter]MBA2960987.1 hypothetical protein [Ramlibacter sp. CGMCC 1.13660]MVQ30933.1 hypothetical protein [Ramlibacter pinisoli]
MADSYTFLRPARLPLSMADLGTDTVGPLPAEQAVPCLRQAFPQLEWPSATEARGELAEGWVEFRLHDDEKLGAWLSMRCSLRADYSGAVQALCDRYGWIAFDSGARLIQPGRARLEAGA